MQVIVRGLWLGLILVFFSGCRTADGSRADAKLQVFASGMQISADDTVLVGKEIRYLPGNVVRSGLELRVNSADVVTGDDGLPAVELRVSTEEARRLYELMVANEGGTIFLALDGVIVSASSLLHLSPGEVYVVPLHGSYEEREATARKIVRSCGRVRS